MTVFAANTEFYVEECCNCHMLFALTVDFQKQRRNDKRTFYCPSGHAQHYTGKSEAERLKAELERAQQMREAAEARAATAAQEREQIAKMHKKMRTRVMNGVCPCCDRTFQNLMQHMKTEHPDFDSKKTLATMRAAFGMSQDAVAKEVGVRQNDVSRYERDKPLPEHTKKALEWWIDKNQGRVPA
jgi:DNA-binding XRE family transcriptional regulator